MKGKTKKEDWIIGIGGTEEDDVSMYKLTGTRYQAKREIMRIIRRDRENDKESYNYGTENIKEIEERGDGSLYGYNCFSDYHIDYAARPLNLLKDSKEVA